MTDLHVIDLHLIGIGTGNPDHLTMAAMRAMNDAELILLPRKGRQAGGEGDGRSDLVDLRRTICDAVLTQPVRVVEFDLPERDTDVPYIEAVRDWHAAIAAAWRAEIEAHLPQGGKLALLVWGDPSLYDSTLRIAARLQREGLALRTHVVPGITSVQLLTAAHAIPLNMLASPVTITTGRRLRERGWPEGADTLVVMLDGACAFETLTPEGLEIWWGGFLGLPQQALVSGPLAEAGPRIVTLRAALREKHGWIMDIYLLRRVSSPR